MSSVFHVSAPIPLHLAGEARDLAARIRQHPRPEDLRSETSDLVQRLTRAGLESFFLAPVERLGLGVVTGSVVKVGLGSSAKAIGMAVARIVGGLSAVQMLQVADLLDSTVVERPDGGASAPGSP